MKFCGFFFSGGSLNLCKFHILFPSKETKPKTPDCVPMYIIYFLLSLKRKKEVKSLSRI